MKNIHILPTDKPSRLYCSNQGKWCFVSEEIKYITDVIQICTNYNIYITNSEKIKEGDWFLNTLDVTIDKCEDIISQKNVNLSSWLKKIILTTDTDLIKDGVQAIDDEFLEWFVKNPSCEYVKVIDKMRIFNVDELRERHRKGLPHLYSEKIAYKIIIPKEEPRILTVEEFNKAKISYEEPKQEKLEEETIEEHFLSCIKNVLQFGNDAQAIRFMEKYYESKKEEDEK